MVSIGRVERSCWMRRKLDVLTVCLNILNFLVFSVNAATAPSQEGFISIDFGGAGGIDADTTLNWTNDYQQYLAIAPQLARDGVTTTARATLNVSAPVENEERLKTALVFLPREAASHSAISRRSKFCFNLSVDYNATGSSTNYLLRAMFPTSSLVVNDTNGKNIPVAAFSTRFYFTVDSTYIATVELDQTLPQTIELVISSLSDVLYVCLVPLEDGSSMPAISTLELRPLVNFTQLYNRGTETASRGIAVQTTYLMTISRQNFGSDMGFYTNLLPKSRTLRYPHDRYDRFWSSPPVTDLNVRSVENTSFVDLTIPPDDCLDAPEPVIRTAWEGIDLKSNITFTWNLSNARRPQRPISTFYWNIMVCDISFQENQTRFVDISYRVLDSSSNRRTGLFRGWPILDGYQQSNILTSDKWTFTGNTISVTIAPNGSTNQPALVNMAELFGEINAVTGRTVTVDVKAVADLAQMVPSELDSTGDPCLPIPWAWVVCSMELPPRITQINVTGKGIKGSLPASVSGLDRLTVLDLSFNHLSSALDLAPLTNSSTLRELILDSNGIQGPVPSLRPLSLTNLERLSVSNNNLQGNLSSVLPAMDVTLMTLNLSRNNFSGPIPKGAIEKNLTGLQSMDLSHNQLSGELNLDLTLLGNIETLILNDNQLQGKVPSSVWDARNLKLQLVDLDRNKFTDLDLTSWYENLRSLNKSNSVPVRVRLRDNRIDRIVPDPKTMVIPMENMHQNASVLLGGNPWCERNKARSSKKVVVRFLCRGEETDDFLKSPDHGLRTQTLVAIIVPCGLLLVIVSCVFAYCLWKIRRRAIELRQIQEALTKEHVKPRFFGYEELRAATNAFSNRNVLGKGGFGIVYKAELADGSVLAVKRLKTNATDRDISEFVKEIINISGIKHKHLIQLKGCCVRDKQRLLVYEYAENKSLAEALCCPNKPFVLTWQQRFKICLGIARGLAYLHEELQPKMIHRDIKPQNILLDKEYNAKIADFGLVRPSQVDHTSITITIGGTRGYIPPEYVTEGLVSEKLDVFSLGVVFLEIVAGRLWLDTALSEEQAVLRNWAISMFDQGKVLALVDKQLNGEYNEEEVLLVLHTALACCQIDSKKRPTMSQVVNWLMKHADLAMDIVKELRGVNPHFCLEGIVEEDQLDEPDPKEVEEFALIPSNGTDSCEGSTEVAHIMPLGPLSR
ncbi:hypothetical protein R1sor_019708 [Riccia sorocarpa]|uniref:Protein kinase domain-containing protein n=1 Tax=Riccia sorocarpa TaxID=122646 RepID=A0ABD3IED4_9MARC